MCALSPRVKRGTPPSSTLRKHTYRKALPELRRDFQDRCAYCMVYIGDRSDREIEIDHFDPRRKNSSIQDYSNLFLADGHCNGSKSDKWPKRSERALMMHFLNCCEVPDYDEEIFEDPITHKLVGVTPAAKYHIREIDLNAEHLVQHRKRRYELWQQLSGKAIILRGNTFPVDLFTTLRDIAARMIPPIKAPPPAPAAP